jgi:RNA polymerase sigma factor (sigma-70 family)
MTQVITNYTTRDLDDYYANLNRLPRLSREERAQLASTPNPDTETRNRIIEEHLRLVNHIARQMCPPAYYHTLPDIIGEVSLTLVTIAHRYPFGAGGDFTRYVAACTEGVVKRTISYDRLIKVPSSAISRAKQQGTESQLYDLQPKSLDELMVWFDTDDLEEPPVHPILPNEAAPERDPRLRAQVQEWLSYLSPRAQKVLTLRYGLSDEDERGRTQRDVAQELGIKRHNVDALERDAKKRIRALVEGTGTIIEKDGKRQIIGIYTFTPPTLTPEEEILFMQVATQLTEQQGEVSCRALARATGKSIHRATVFLREHPEHFPRRSTAHQSKSTRIARLEAIYDVWKAQGKPIKGKELAKAARVQRQLVTEFLRERRAQEGERQHV